MKLKVFYEDLKGYVTVFEDVKSVKLCKRDNINMFIVENISGDDEDTFRIALAETSLLYLIDLDTMQELFRYEKYCY